MLRRLKPEIRQDEDLIEDIKMVLLIRQLHSLMQQYQLFEMKGEDMLFTSS